MCITFLNNVYVNNKTVYDEKSTRVYVEIQKAKTVWAELQHVRCAWIVSSMGDIIATIASAKESSAKTDAAPLKRHHQVEVYKA